MYKYEFKLHRSEFLRTSLKEMLSEMIEDISIVDLKDIDQIKLHIETIEDDIAFYRNEIQKEQMREELKQAA